MANQSFNRAGVDFEIIYKKCNLVAVNKPAGIAVHRSSYVGADEYFVVQQLRDQLEQKVYPCHRLDKKTTGVLLFALSPELNRAIQQQFAQNLVKKKYLAIVRGYTDDQGTIDYPLINDKGKKQEAVTHYTALSRSELDIPMGKFNTSRYSLVEVFPETGRMHQIRKHFAHILHPIIGDRPHGCNKQNKLFKERFDMTTMMLHASEVSLRHPGLGEEIIIEARLHNEFKRMMKFMKFCI